MIDINAMATTLITAAARYDVAKSSLEAVGVIIEKESKAMIGTYQQGWEQLADSTEAHKAKMGYPSNAPLLATGEMRDSIAHNVGGTAVHIGTNNKKMRYHEFGTNRIPPRPVFGLVFDRKKDEVMDLIGDSVVKLL